MLRIVVVDDEAPIREWLVYSIEKQGMPFEVVATAASGEEAVSVIFEHKPDVVLTDIKMPGMDGMELMREVHQMLPYTMFIVLTNYADFSYAKQAITCGAKEYLLKSELRGKDLAAALGKVLEEKRAITYKKKHDILQNGYVDLYGLYLEFEKENHEASFWEKYHMIDGHPYSVIGIYESKEYPQREFILDLLEGVKPKFYITALRQGIVYIIVQDTTEEVLEEKVRAFGNKLEESKQCSMGISAMYTDLNRSIEAIEQADQVLSYTFFEQERKALHYYDLRKRCLLERNEVREKYHEILKDLSLRLYDKAKKGIEEWFDRMQEIHIEDVNWGKEMCQRMVFSVEERFYQLHAIQEGIEGYQQPNNLKVCRVRCEELINKMIGEEGDTGHKAIEVGLDFIHQNYARNISLAEVAQVAYLSPEYFSRLFKEEMGENFSVYLMMYRLEKAKELLIHSELRVSEIAYQVGYGTPGYFSKIYKKYMGKSPEEER